MSVMMSMPSHASNAHDNIDMLSTKRDTKTKETKGANTTSNDNVDMGQKTKKGTNSSLFALVDTKTAKDTKNNSRDQNKRNMNK